MAGRKQDDKDQKRAIAMIIRTIIPTGIRTA